MYMYYMYMYDTVELFTILTLGYRDMQVGVLEISESQN